MINGHIREVLHIPRNQVNQINDKLTVKPNIIFETIVQEDPHREITSTHSTQ